MGEQLAKSPNCLSSDVRVVWAREAERLFHLAPLSPAAPAAAALATPVHDEVRLVHAFNVGKRAVPQLSVIDRPAGTAELAEDFWRLSKADNKEIEVDRVLHATHGLQHSESDRASRERNGMSRVARRASNDRSLVVTTILPQVVFAGRYLRRDRLLTALQKRLDLGQQSDRPCHAKALSHLASKGSHAALRQFVNPLDSLNPLRTQKQVIGSKNG